MAQWVNCLWNNIFVNPPPLPLSPTPSATGSYGWQVDWQAGRLADKIQVNFENFKIG